MLATSATTTDLITTWATVGAAAGTVFTLLVAVLTLRTQVQASLRSQAARVILDQELGDKGKTFVIHNLSDLPISDVRLKARLYEGRVPVFGKSIPLHPENQILASGADMWAPLPPLDYSGQLAADVTFRDSSGLSWRRKWPSGLLQLQQRGPRREVISFAFYGVLLITLSVLIITDTPGPGIFNNIIGIVALIVGVRAIVIALGIARKGFRRPFLPSASDNSEEQQFSDNSEENATPSKHP